MLQRDIAAWWVVYIQSNVLGSVEKHQTMPTFQITNMSNMDITRNAFSAYLNDVGNFSSRGHSVKRGWIQQNLVRQAIFESFAATSPLISQPHHIKQVFQRKDLHARWIAPS